MAKYEIQITGDTKAIKEDLKRQGFRWVPTCVSWAKPITDGMAETIRRGGRPAQDALASIHGRKKGCQTLLSEAGKIGVVVYISPTYQTPVPREDSAVPGLDYCDAQGNYIGGKRIPGSAPDDLI